MPVEKIKVAVIGGGLVGLSTALCITESLPQCTITVISEEFSPNTTSDVAAGCLIPHSYPDTSLDQQKSWFKETFDYLFKIANSSEAGEAGIHLISGWQIFKSAPKETYPFWWQTVLGFRMMNKAELAKFPSYTFGQAFTTLKCQASQYLPWMEKKIKSNGGYLERRKINNVWDLHGIYDVVVNCSGLGSRHLFGDHSIYPVKGQVLEVNAPWIKHFIRDGDGNTYIYPGISCVTLGGTRQNGVWSNLPNEQASKGILDRCCHLEPSLCEVSVIQEKVGLRPTRSALRIEKDILIKNGKQLTVVHNYGHGGGGYSIHWGTARKVSKLLQEVIPLPHNVYTKSKL
ncbi:D-aspartate oxidase isoform X1 [Hyla sarda]|uniref:D-aspartate oxidase isoform X1 n=1 Tax=Hyla sarda TaxID=327740 RepID=UPI0024C3EFA5|nr:D-aspartate oxidase isoform X1 [Hyla sarda]